MSLLHDLFVATEPKIEVLESGRTCGCCPMVMSAGCRVLATQIQLPDGTPDIKLYFPDVLHHSRFEMQLARAH